ncbi:hypothetical protein [Arcobacter sp.]|uniref:hypothetical protein n=1 Tax=unclassified Arcobacter TaxID=2593671 RepID=UPI003B0070B4
MYQNFNEIILNEYKKSSSEITSFFYNDKKYWLKKARATKSSLSHKIYYKFFKLELIVPVEEKTAKDALVFETNKLIKFKNLGIEVPTIIFKNEEFFILEDTGKNINSYIRKRDIKKEKMYYFIDKVILHLSKIHNNGEFHGGAQARNFTYKDNEINTIDLEDSFDKSIDIKLLQFRDFLLFLLSLTKTRASFELDYNYIIEKYIFLTKNYTFKNKLNKLASKISFLIYLSDKKVINNILGRDVKSFFKLFKILKNL